GVGEGAEGRFEGHIGGSGEVGAERRAEPDAFVADADLADSDQADHDLADHDLVNAQTSLGEWLAAPPVPPSPRALVGPGLLLFFAAVLFLLTTVLALRG